MLASLRHNLAGLFRFSGRSTRARFWPYAVVVILCVMAGLLLVMTSSIVDVLARMQRFAAATAGCGASLWSI